MQKKNNTLRVGYTCPHCGAAEQSTVQEWLAAVLEGRTLPCRCCQKPIDTAQTVYVPMQPMPLGWVTAL